MSSLEFHEVHKRFRDTVALHSLSFKVVSGEFLSMLGPSGCGKSTALRISAGFESATTGSVLVDGNDISAIPAHRRDMGMVFQAYSLFPNMSAAENVEFGLRVRRVDTPTRSARVKELLELVGLAEAARRYPHQLSGGMQQRIALARALAIEPRVLLLDEPLSALDAKVRVQLREEIRRIQARVGITMVYVTHDQEEALSISDRIVVMSNGRIEQIGTPSDIYTNPQTIFVADFIGVANRFEGEVMDQDRVRVGTGDMYVSAEDARNHRQGDRVLLVVRPELCTLSSVGGESRNGGLDGTVLSTVFLGAVIRVTLATVVGELSVQLPSAQRDRWRIGTPGRVSFPMDAPKLLSLQNGNRPEVKTEE